MILSARSAIEDRVCGLDMGASDYLSKPFAFAELEARVRSLLRRSFIMKDMILEEGPVTVDTKARTVKVGGVKVDLAPKEYMIFEYLLINAGKVVSSEDLIEHVWQSDVNYFTASVKVHISNLRKKTYGSMRLRYDFHSTWHRIYNNKSGGLGYEKKIP